jgi:WD40 repeat protein
MIAKNCKYLQGFDSIKNMKFKPAILLTGFISFTTVSNAAIAYAIDLQNDRFVTFDVNDPGNETVLATSYTGSYFGLDFNNRGTTLYGLLFTGLGAAQLDSLDLNDGSVLGSVGITGLTADAVVTGLTIGPNNFAHLTSYGGTTSRLYTIDLTTGTTALVGVMTSAGLVVDIAASPGGDLVVHNATTDTFDVVNPDTGALTTIGSHGIDANFTQGMDFDPESGLLYAALYSNDRVNTYGTVSIFDGKVTPIAGLLTGEYEIAIVPEPGTLSLLIVSGAMMFRRKRS